MMHQNKGSQEKFSGYLGFGKKNHAVFFETLIFGLMTLLTSIGMAFILRFCSDIQFRRCMIISTIISSFLFGFLFYRLHGQYELTKKGDKLFGRVRKSMFKLKILSISFICLIVIPAIVVLFTVQEEDNKSKVLWVTCVGFTGQILLLTLGHQFTNTLDSMTDRNGNNTSFDNNQNNSQIQIIHSQNLQQIRVSNPCKIIFRDLYVSIRNALQAIIIVSLVYIPFFLTNQIYEKKLSLRSLGYWDDGFMERGSFKFQQIIGHKKYGQQPYQYWAILLNNNSVSTQLSNGENVTFQKIKEILSADQYFYKWNNQSLRQQNSTKFYKQYVWKLQNGTVMKLNKTNNNVNFSTINETSKTQISIGVYDAYADYYARIPYLQGQLYFIDQQYSPKIVYLKESNELYQFKQSNKIYSWVQPSQQYTNSTHFRAIFTLFSGLRQTSSFIYSYLLQNKTQKSLQSCTNSPISSVCSIRNIDNQPQQFQYGGGVFNSKNVLYIKQINQSTLANYSFTLINPENHLKLSWSSVGNFWQTVRLTDNSNNILSFAKYSIYCGPMQECPSILVSNQTGKINFVYGKILSFNYQWSTVVKFHTFSESTETFQYSFQPIQYIYFWMKILFFIILSASFLSTLIYIVFRASHMKIYSYSLNVSSRRFSLIDPVSHFIITNIILFTGAFPIYILTGNFRYSSSLQAINLNKSFAVFLTFILYYGTLRSWRKSVYESKFFKSLNYAPQLAKHSFLKRTLEEKGVPVRYELIDMIYNQGFSLKFLNSYAVHSVLLKQDPVDSLRMQLLEIAKLEKRELNTIISQYKIKRETFDFSIPIFITMFLLLLYALIAYPLGVQLSQSVLLFMGGMVMIAGIVSICQFGWQHRIEVFVKQVNGIVILKETKKKDLLKIALLGFLMATTQILMSLFGYKIGSLFQLSIISRMLMSCGFCFLGFVLASIGHYIWNYFPGILGIIIIRSKVINLQKG